MKNKNSFDSTIFESSKNNFSLMKSKSTLNSNDSYYSKFPFKII